MTAAKTEVSGFWFAYIETLTGLAIIFIILFVAAANRERVINAQHERLVRSWETVKGELTKLQAAPVPDPQMGGMRITLADSLIFPLGSAILNKMGEDKIIEIAKALVRFYRSNVFFTSAMGIKVGGHTDKTGGDIVNFPLSYERAENVANIIRRSFQSNGLTVEVTPIAYGSKYPLPGHSAQIEPRNRRITIVVELLSTELLSRLEN